MAWKDPIPPAVNKKNKTPSQAKESKDNVFETVIKSDDWRDFTETFLVNHFLLRRSHNLTSTRFLRQWRTLSPIVQVIEYKYNSVQNDARMLPATVWPYQPTWSIGNSPPPGPGHEGVVEDMKEGYLAVLLPQHKEDLIERGHRLVDSWVMTKLLRPSRLHLLCPWAQ